MKSIATLALLMGFVLIAGAQELSYGIKAGLNFSNLSGDLEQDDEGMTVEEFRRITSFHVGLGFSYNITDWFGARGELMYSQKGVRYSYEGAAYGIFTTDIDQETFYANGTRESTNNIINSYIDIPVTLYLRPFEWLEFSAGPSVGFLVGATGLGQTSFTGKVGNTAITDASYTYDQNFFRDEAGEADFTNSPPPIRIGGKDVTLPGSSGAYYEYSEKDGNYFNIIDLGINASLAFFLSETLYVSGRLNYGLSDVTNNYYDRSQVKLDANNDFIPRSDFDRNVSIQASVGFNLR